MYCRCCCIDCLQYICTEFCILLYHQWLTRNICELNKAIEFCTHSTSLAKQCVKKSKATVCFRPLHRHLTLLDVWQDNNVYASEPQGFKLKFNFNFLQSQRPAKRLSTSLSVSASFCAAVLPMWVSYISSIGLWTSSTISSLSVSTISALSLVDLISDLSFSARLLFATLLSGFAFRVLLRFRLLCTPLSIWGSWASWSILDLPRFRLGLAVSLGISSAGSPSRFRLAGSAASLIGREFRCRCRTEFPARPLLDLVGAFAFRSLRSACSKVLRPFAATFFLGLFRDGMRSSSSGIKSPRTASTSACQHSFHQHERHFDTTMCKEIRLDSDAVLLTEFEARQV